MEEHSTHNPEIKGLYPAAGTGREKMGKSWVLILQVTLMALAHKGTSNLSEFRVTATNSLTHNF